MATRERRSRSDFFDRRLQELLAQALINNPEISSEEVAIAAVGGYGRGELFPGSDLDILIVVGSHTSHIEPLVNSILYPLWDEKIKIDHSVRTPKETLQTAEEDLKVLLGLLDIRFVAGAATLIKSVSDGALKLWRKDARKKVAILKKLLTQQHQRAGDLAYLLEPDLKEARGGLRDVVAVRALAVSALVEIPMERISVSASVLENVRESLHKVSGRDKLLFQEQDKVAVDLGYPDADALMSDVAQSARTIDYCLSRALQEIDSQEPQGLGRFFTRKNREEISRGVFVMGREVWAAPDFDLDEDPVLPLRLAAAAAQRGLVIARESATAIAEQLSQEKGALTNPWPREAREQLISLIGAGSAMVAVFETLEQEEILFHYLPEWRMVRSLPQRNALHRHTVDRHMLETAVCAAAYARKVKRPDLLFVAALLHDIGKGTQEDHSERGALMITSIAERIGFNTSDIQTLQMLVRHHLLLPATATRRDLDDPATIAAVAEQVPDNLELLHYLSFADGEATGKAAWSEWKARLVEDLVYRVKLLRSGRLVDSEPILEHYEAVEKLHVEVEDRTDDLAITIASPDRTGLLSIISGVLSNLRLDVRSARTKTVGNVAYMRWIVIADPHIDPPKAIDIENLINKSLDGTFDVAQKIEERKRAYALAPSIPVPPPVVSILQDAATDASIIEVRSHDRPALLFTIGGAITSCQVDIRSAIVTTLGSEAIDTLYVTEINGGALSQERAEEVRRRIEALL